MILKFNEFGLSEDILKGIEDLGFEEASAIQRQAIGPILERKDVIGQAQTGTGKTAAFAIPTLEIVDQSKAVQALILCPTRELSIQVADEISKLGKYKKIRVLAVYGGAPFKRQEKALKSGAQIVVATPGRIMDHMRRKTIDLSNLKICILDEADEMLDMGFRSDMAYILDRTNDNRQTCFFSATMGNEVESFSRSYQNNPVKIRIKNTNLTVDNIDQYYIELAEQRKVDTLQKLIDHYDPNLAIVFCNTKRRVDMLTSKLKSRGYLASGLHGDMRQNQRDRVMGDFRKSKTDILVATDVAARGIDVGSIDLVVNFDMPQDNEFYVHRIGRTARAGRKGMSVSFITKKDQDKLKTIKRYTKADMKYLDINNLDNLTEKNSHILKDYLEDRIIKAKDLSKYQNIIDMLMEDGHSPYLISQVLLKLMLENTTIRPKKERSKNQEKTKPGTRQRPSKSLKSYQEIFIDKGQRDGLNKRDIIEMLKSTGNIQDQDIGNIDIKKNYSFVQVPKESLGKIIGDLNDSKYKGKKLRVELASK